MSKAADEQSKVSTQQAKSQVEEILRNIVAKECPPVKEADIANFKPGTRGLPEDIQSLLNAWLRYSKGYRQTYYVLTVGIILFGALATALTDGDVWYNYWKTAAALLATVCGGLNSALTPYREHKKFDEAFVVLNTAKHAYGTNPYVSLCEVGKAVAYGEAIIHKGG